MSPSILYPTNVCFGIRSPLDASINNSVTFLSPRFCFASSCPTHRRTLSRVQRKLIRTPEPVSKPVSICIFSPPTTHQSFGLPAPLGIVVPLYSSLLLSDAAPCLFRAHLRTLLSLFLLYLCPFVRPCFFGYTTVQPGSWMR